MTTSWQQAAAAREILSRETGAIHKDHGGKLRVALAYPNSYYVGMSSLALQILYRMFNAEPDVVCERVFWDAQAWQAGQPLLTLESQTPVAEFDVWAFTVSFELDYFNVVAMLRQAGIAADPPVSFPAPLLVQGGRERADGSTPTGSDRPLLIAGGPAVTMNPEPLAPFFDAMVIGEAEELLPRLIELLKSAEPDRQRLLDALARLPGVYAPGRAGPAPAGRRIERLWVRDVDRLEPISSLYTPDTEFGDMHLIEIARGCGRGCRFCLAGYVYRPPREQPLERIVAWAKDALALRLPDFAHGGGSGERPSRPRLWTGAGQMPMPQPTPRRMKNTRGGLEALAGLVVGGRNRLILKGGFAQPRDRGGGPFSGQSPMPAAAPRPVEKCPGLEASAGYIVGESDRLKPRDQSGGRRFPGQPPGIGLVSAAVSDHSRIDELAAELHSLGARLSASSMRADPISVPLVRALRASGSQTLTLAPEAGAERLRRLIGKTQTEDDLLAAVELAQTLDFPQLKLYFMVGHPTESDDDVQAIVDLTLKARAIFKRNLAINATPFVPKPHTPFQWQAQASVKTLQARQTALKRHLGRHGVAVDADSPQWAEVQGVLARGDRRLAWPLLDLAGRPTVRDFHASLARHGLTAAEFVAARDAGSFQPWEIVDPGVSTSYLLREDRLAGAGRPGHRCPPNTAPCRACGVCVPQEVDR